jgi:hypothetical protein
VEGEGWGRGAGVEPHIQGPTRVTQGQHAAIHEVTTTTTTTTNHNTNPPTHIRQPSDDPCGDDGRQPRVQVLHGAGAELPRAATDGSEDGEAVGRRQAGAIDQGGQTRPWGHLSTLLNGGTIQGEHACEQW